MNRKWKFIYKNRYNCKIVNIKSSAEDFLGDLKLILELLSILECEEMIGIQIPAIGMGLWRADPKDVLLIFKK